MAITDSRNKEGTLTLDGDAFGVQATAVSLNPSVSTEGDSVETLSGDTIDPDEVIDWTLNIEAIQDFTDPAGFIEFCRANAGSTVAFVWYPQGSVVAADNPKYAGTVKVRPAVIGGGVNVRLTSSVEFPVVTLDDPDYTP